MSMHNGSSPECLIVVLNYNGSDDTAALLRSLCGQRGERNWATLVIDNGSRAAEYQRLRDWRYERGGRSYACTEVSSLTPDPSRPLRATGTYLFASRENLGFAAGNNLGIRCAQAARIPTVLLLNNDTECDPDFLACLQRRHAANRRGITFPQIRYFDRPEVLWNTGAKLRFPLRVTYFNQGVRVDHARFPPDEQIDFATGCALMFDPEHVGELAEDFFFGEEDVELARSCRERGVGYALARESILYHKVGATASAHSKRVVGRTVNRLVHVQLVFAGPRRLLAETLYVLQTVRHLRRAPHRLPLGQCVRVARQMRAYARASTSVCRSFWQSYVFDEDRPIDSLDELPPCLHPLA